MDDPSWPNDWPDPDNHKKKKDSPDLLKKLNSSTTAIGMAIVLLGIILLVKNVASWFPPNPPPPPPIQPVIVPQHSWPSLPSTAASCTIDLVHNQHNCQHLKALTFEANPHYGQTVVKLTLDPFTTGYTGARFEIAYGSHNSQGWTVNIGDSSGNGGYAGDNGTQSNDAELQIVDGQLAIYGSDYTNPEHTLDGHRQLFVQGNFAGSGETVTLEVQNQRVWWLDQWGEIGSLEGSALYALARQPDEEGSTNYDIYAAFNRVIESNGRSGTGVEQVIITLIPAE